MSTQGSRWSKNSKILSMQFVNDTLNKIIMRLHKKDEENKVPCVSKKFFQTTYRGTALSYESKLPYYLHQFSICNLELIIHMEQFDEFSPYLDHLSYYDNNWFSLLFIAVNSHFPSKKGVKKLSILFSFFFIAMRQILLQQQSYLS